MKKSDYNKLVKLRFLGDNGEIKNYSSKAPYKLTDINEILSKQLTERIDYNSIIITFPTGTGLGTTGSFGKDKILIDHVNNQSKVFKILDEMGVTFADGTSLTDKKYAQHRIAMLIVDDCTAFINDTYANPFSDNLAYNKSDQLKSTHIKKKEFKPGCFDTFQWMFSGFFIANDKTRFKYEKQVIDPILNAIKEHQEYLTKKENIPQLAKLGYMYNTLWYSGRICWGSNGQIDKTGYDCEDNPKYKIEMCEPKNEKIENLIYDAWGMHIERAQIHPNFIDFQTLIKKGKKLSPHEIKLRKPNKTMEEWVDVLTDKNYKYSSLYGNKKAVYNHLLCVIGNGYGINKQGYVISEASGADQDRDVYGAWENAKFSKEIQKVVDKILSYPEVKKTLDVTHKYTVASQKKYDNEYGVGKSKELEKLIKKIKKENPKEWKEMFGEDRESLLPEKKPYQPYYPISNYSIIHIIDNPEKGIKPHKSVEKACIEICEEIITHEKEESKENRDNVKFAKAFLANRGRTEFAKFIPKFIDKYKLENDIYKILDDKLSPYFKMIKGRNVQTDKKQDVCIFGLNDTKFADHADNNYYAYISFSEKTSKSLPFDFVNEVKDWMPFGKDIQEAMNEIKKLEDIKHVRFFYENDYDHLTRINIKIIVHDDGDYVEDEIESENNFKSKGFHVGDLMMSYKLPGTDLLFTTTKPEPLGSTHPDNKNGKEYFGLNKQLDVYNLEPKEHLANFNIDERGFNTLNSESKHWVAKWMLEQHTAMKKSNPDYGNAGKEGKRSLYAHDFILWLEKHIDEHLIENYNQTKAKMSQNKV